MVKVRKHKSVVKTIVLVLLEQAPAGHGSSSCLLLKMNASLSPASSVPLEVPLEVLLPFSKNTLIMTHRATVGAKDECLVSPESLC